MTGVERRNQQRGLLFISPLIVFCLALCRSPLAGTICFSSGDHPTGGRETHNLWNCSEYPLFICSGIAVVAVTCSALAAYGYSRIEWKGRDPAFRILLTIMTIPLLALMVSSYLHLKDLGGIGTFKLLWAWTSFASAFNVFLLRRFFLGLPKDISEAARIDGCSEAGIFFQIILPLCKQVLLVMVLFQFLYTWNDLVVLQSFPTCQLHAALTLFGLPILIALLMTQKSFLEGIAAGGRKN